MPEPMTAATKKAVSYTHLDVYKRQAYRSAFMMLERRIGLFLNLPLATIDRLAIEREIGKIGQQ